MKYYLIAGEASGDLHGSNLMKGLKECDKECDFRFWGGDLMASVGGTIVKHYRDNSIMGFVEVVKNIRKIGSNLSFCKKDILSYSPDVLILIDYPGFNFRIAHFAKKHGIKVFYYIAPKVWAWKESRVKRLQKDVDKLFIIFPFEVDYFKKWNIDAVYCGNPLIDSIASQAEPLSLSEVEDQASDSRKVVALLAGSRKTEIAYLMPRFVKVSQEMGQQARFIIAAAPSIDLEVYTSFIKGTNIEVVQGETYALLRRADAAVIASGTASLEAALIGTPQVVGYGGNPISAMIAQLLVKIKYFSLGNLILGREAIKELFQKNCTANNITAELSLLLFDSSYREKMLKAYDEIRSLLGGEGASKRVAQEMIKILKNESI